MSHKTQHRFDIPDYARFGLDSEFLKHIYDNIDGTGPVSQSIRDALMNDALAANAWQRNEVSADNAAQRQVDTTRELRQTQFQDTVSSAQAAGINPIMALGYGMSSPASAPQASSPAGSTSSGAPRATLDSILNAVFSFQRFQLNKAQIGVAKAERDVMQQQASNIAADTKVKENSASNLLESTRGIKLDNDWKEATLQDRKEAVKLQNDLTRSDIASIEKGIEKMDKEIDKFDAEILAYGAKALADNMTAYRIVALLPFEQSFQRAATAEKYAAATEHSAAAESHKASAAYSLVAAAYQHRVLNSGIIESNAKLAGLDVDVKEIEKKFAQWDYQVKTGDEEGLITDDKFAKFCLGTASTLGALIQASGISVGFGGTISRSTSSSTSRSVSDVYSQSDVYRH